MPLTELTALCLCGFSHPIALLSLTLVTASPGRSPDLGPNSQLMCFLEPSQGNSIQCCSPGTLRLHLFGEYLPAPLGQPWARKSVTAPREPRRPLSSLKHTVCGTTAFGSSAWRLEKLPWLFPVSPSSLLAPQNSQEHLPLPLPPFFLSLPSFSPSFLPPSLPPSLPCVS